MLKQLNDEQRKQVEKNMGLIGKVIKDRVRNINKIGIYTYEDLFQIGSIGLCKAVATHNPQHGAFSTYAYILIRNEIFKAIEYATYRKSKEEFISAEKYNNKMYTVDNYNVFTNLIIPINKALDETKGTTRKGVQALLLCTQGYTCREIGIRMGVPANYVTAWISKARKYLRSSIIELSNLSKAA